MDCFQLHRLASAQELLSSKNSISSNSTSTSLAVAKMASAPWVCDDISPVVTEATDHRCRDAPTGGARCLSAVPAAAVHLPKPVRAPALQLPCLPAAAVLQPPAPLRHAASSRMLAVPHAAALRPRSCKQAPPAQPAGGKALNSTNNCQ